MDAQTPGIHLLITFIVGGFFFFLRHVLLLCISGWLPDPTSPVVVGLQVFTAMPDGIKTLDNKCLTYFELGS